MSAPISIAPGPSAEKPRSGTIAASVIIASRDRPGMLIETVRSILNDSRPPAEIVVVDQSADAHPELSAAEIEKGVKIRYLHSTSVGLSRARNEGIAAASYDTVVITDDDMRAGAGWLAAMVDALEKKGRASVVTGRVLPGQPERRGGFVPATVLSERPAVYKGRLNGDVLAGGSMAAQRSLLQALGGFDERLGAGTDFPAGEDNDLGFRILEAGLQIHYVPEAVLYHRAWRSYSDYIPGRWRYGLGKGAFYCKHMAAAGMHMASRALRDVGQRLVRLPIRALKNPRRAVGDLAYSFGVAAGLLRWSFRAQGSRNSNTLSSASHGDVAVASGALEPAEMAAKPASVVVCTVGRCAELKRCIDAVITAECPPSEIVVVDQSGAGDVAAILATYDAAKIVHLRQERCGLSAARNLAVASAGQEIIAITDDDCVPDAHWLSAIGQAFAAPDPPAAVTGRVLPLGPETPGAWAVSSRTSAARRLYRGDAVPWHVGTGGNFAVRKCWLERVGAYDERLGAGSAGLAGEDVDLLRRLLKAGACIQYEPAAIVYHERQDAARRFSSRFGYGHGIGAFCGLAARRGDPTATWLLSRWLFLRAKIAVKALFREDWQALREEARVLRGTLAGLSYGLLRST